MKQITIYDLLPLLKKGWVAYAPKFGWMWFDKKPKKLETMYYLDYPHREFVYVVHPIKELAPFDGDWQDSLIKVADHQKATKKVVNHKKKKIVHKQGKGTSKEVFEYILDTFPIEASGFLSQEQVINDFEKWKARNR